MARETLCRYGNCDKPGNGVSINLRHAVKGLGERPTFCCAEHAALWLLRQVHRVEGTGTASEKERIIHTVADTLELSRVYS